MQTIEFENDEDLHYASEMVRIYIALYHLNKRQRHSASIVLCRVTIKNA